MVSMFNFTRNWQTVLKSGHAILYLAKQVWEFLFLSQQPCQHFYITNPFILVIL